MSTQYSARLQAALDRKNANTGFDALPENVMDLKVVPDWIKRYVRVNHKPHPYQYEVVKWMTKMKRGGILNLDPGLGKTFISLLHSNLSYSMHSLVVCNKSQMLVWHEEMRKFYNNRFRFLLAHKEYDGILYSFTERRLSKYDFVITTYESIQSAFRRPSEFQKMYWNNVYCDEVHRIRNAATEMYAMISKIRCKRFWGLTGSLIHNEIADARNIQEIIDPDSIYSLSNIKTLRLQDVGVVLPTLHKNFIYTKFTPKQKGFYDAYSTQAESILSDLNPRNKRTWAEIFAILTRLRQITIAPSLLEDSHDITFKDAEDYKSPRIEAVASKILETKDQGVVFCFFRKSLELITRNLREKGVRCKIIKSQHSASQKQHYIDMFRRGKYRVLLTTYKTGGLGFNLTNANHVYLCSLWWNMQVIQQAFRRCFRPGQVKETNVHFFMKQGSIEDRMFELCKSKANLSDNFLMENFRDIKISKDIIKMLF